MNVRIIGAILVIAGCGGFGISVAAGYRREEEGLRQMLRMVKFMQWELKYRMTPLPELCRQAAGEGKGQLRDVMLGFAAELDKQKEPDVYSCMRTVLHRADGLPRRIRRLFSQLGRSLGRFDLDGQLESLEAVAAACREQLTQLQNSKIKNLRSYRTLGLCAGAALAILFL